VIRSFAIGTVCASVMLSGHALAQKSATQKTQQKRQKQTAVAERSVVEVAPAKKLKIRSVNIDNRLGSVRIVGHTGRKVIIEAVKSARDRRTLERLKVSLVSDPNGRVRIGTSIATGRDMRPIPGGSVRVDLIVRAPNSAKAVGRVWNGKLAVIGMENGADLTANEGDIQVSNALGTIITKSAHGKQKFSYIVGSIDARGLIGDMDLARIRGSRLAARVHDGNIVGRKVHVRNLQLLTMKGNVELQANLILGGKYKISSFEGNIRVTFGNRVPMRIRARAPKGSVKLPPQLRAAKKSHDGAVVVGYNDNYGNKGPRMRHMQNARAPAMLDLTANVGHIAFAF